MRRPLLALLSIAGLGLAVPPAGALEIREITPRISRSRLVADLRLGDPFGETASASLESGTPAALLFTVDLWRQRDGWFDQLVATQRVAFRIRFDPWDEVYRLDRGDGVEETFAGLGSLAYRLSRPMRVPVAPASGLDPDDRYYFAVNVFLRPFSLEGIEDVEDFLSGRVPRGPGIGTLTRLPRALVSLLTAISGLGDEAAARRTPLFRVPERLTGPPAP